MQFYKKLLTSLLLCVGGGWLSGFVTQQGINQWYNHLIQPPGTPPNFVFPVVWTILYTLMAISLTLLWSSTSQNKKAAAIFFTLQLILNFNWSWLFFGMQSPGIALIDLVLLWICVVGTIITLKKHSVFGAYLQLPYLCWVSYAMYLNIYIWLHNG